MRLVIFALSLVTLQSLSNDSEYEKVRGELFWPKLYNSNYTTLYCGIEKQPGERVSIEHVYPAGWIAKYLGCENRKSCDNDKYKAASSDLHNLWPTIQRYNSSRRDLRFGEIEGEKKRFEGDTCDFERTTGKSAIVEPRDEVKGVIARSYLYMIHWYDLPQKNLLPLMIKWHVEHPVTELEKIRNRKIDDIQGWKNPFIKD